MNTVVAWFNTSVVIHRLNGRKYCYPKLLFGDRWFLQDFSFSTTTQFYWLLLADLEHTLVAFCRHVLRSFAVPWLRSPNGLCSRWYQVGRNSLESPWPHRWGDPACWGFEHDVPFSAAACRSEFARLLHIRAGIINQNSVRKTSQQISHLNRVHDTVTYLIDEFRCCQMMG